MSGDEISSEDVELVARAVANYWADGPVAAEFDDIQVARAVLAALAGRLLPAGGSQKIEWARPIPGFSPAPCRPGEADRCATQPEEHVVRTVTEWPDGSVLTGPWLPVEEGTQT